MRKIFQYILMTVALVATASCSNELDEVLQPAGNGSLQFVVSDFPAFGEGPDTRVIGTQDVGKTAWDIDDQIIVTLTSKKFGAQSAVLTYNGTSWSTAVSFLYLDNETPAVSAIYAPCYEVMEDGVMKLSDGMQLGMTEYIPADCSLANGSISINFTGVKRTYSRLRLAGLANQTLTVTTTDFTPAGATEVATAAYTLTTDDNGNAFLYGTFAVEATVSVTQGDIEIGTHAFASATEECMSYALDAMSPYVYDEATNTYTVYTAKGLLDWSEAARADLTTNLVLAADITLTGENNWTPVGAYDESVSDEDNTEYIGTINGGGHTITGLHINNNSDDQGFISALGEGGTVKNLTFADVHMTAGQYSGIVAGNSKGTIENCHVTSGVNSYIHGSQCVGGIVGYNVGSVTGCTNNGTVSGSGKYVGGIVGHGTADAVITNCTNNGTVSGEDEYVGGIVGENLGSVTNCTNSGTVSGDIRVGGIAGWQCFVPITNCTNSGIVSGTDYYVGGIAGGISHSATVIGCYNTVDVTGGSYVGGIAGYMSSEFGATITNCYNTAAITGEKRVGGIAGFHGTDRTVTNCYSTGTITATGTDAEYGGVVGYTNGGTITNCYYLNTAASGGINGADVEGQAEAKTAAEFASADMAVLLNGDQTDAPWEYIEGNATPTLKFFNKNKN